MSYILEALRKSEQQRQLGGAPKLHSAQFTTAAPENRSPWLYAAALTLALIAFGIGWLRPWQTELHGSTADPVVITQRSEPAVAPVREQPVSPLVIEPPRREVAAPRAAAPATAVELHAAQTGTRHAADSSPPNTLPAREKQNPAPSVAARAQSDKVLSIAELPPALRQELPPIAVSIHAYSGTPKDRLVGVNDRLLHEGDAVSDDLILERITPDGMVFKFKGVRFQRGVQ
jgi:general secretion pathway protein B